MYTKAIEEFIIANWNNIEINNREFLKLFEEVLNKELETNVELILSDNYNREKDCYESYGYYDKYSLIKANVYISPKVYEISIHRRVNYGEFDEKIIRPFELLMIILHEYAHAYQDKIEKSKEQSVLKDILTYSFDMRLGELEPKNSEYYITSKSDKKYMEGLYNSFHDYFPHEKHANYMAYELLSRIMQTIKMDEETREYLNNIIMENLFLGYEANGSNLWCTTKILMSRINAKTPIEFFDYNSLSMLERLSLGMPLEMNEIEEVKEMFNERLGVSSEMVNKR